jgi:hypothetical protein
MMSDWKDLVADYRKQYDDKSGIPEYVESLLPTYYGTVYDEYHRLIGSPMGITIQDNHVGMAMWEVMNLEIYDEYYELFMDAWNNAEEEE